MRRNLTRLYFDNVPIDIEFLSMGHSDSRVHRQGCWSGVVFTGCVSKRVTPIALL